MKVVLILFCMVVAVVALSPPGGLSVLAPASTRVQEMMNELKSSVEDKVNGVHFTKFTAISYKTQIVAGVNYFVKINVGDSYIHVRVWSKLDGNNVVSRVQTGKTLSDPIEYF